MVKDGEKEESEFIELLTTCRRAAICFYVNDLVTRLPETQSAHTAANASRLQVLDDERNTAVVKIVYYTHTV